MDDKQTYEFMPRPLILVTNDDGLVSEGLWATVEALLPLGEVLAVAPDQQWSGAGRAMPRTVTGQLTEAHREIEGTWVQAYTIDSSPALAVQHGILELASRRPSLVVSGVNHGANMSTDVTISGTVGAALEASAFNIPSLAVSLEMAPRYYLSGYEGIDYTGAKAFVRRFARHLLTSAAPFGVDVFNLNIPSNATPLTPWRYTRLSRQRYFEPTARIDGKGRLNYRLIQAEECMDEDTDLYTVLVERMVSVTPLSLDLTSAVDPTLMSEDLTAELSAYQAIPFMVPKPSVSSVCDPVVG